MTNKNPVSQYKPDQITKDILANFKMISDIPRGSGNEEEIRNFMLKWANTNNFKAFADEAGNVIIKVPASKGMEKKPIVVLQGHMDMVCEKTPDSDHDFSKDPIKFVYDGEWLKADKTTLGADNGIAMAMAMSLATDRNISHPELELLFTVEEETGLTGANELKPETLEGKYLINLDSEEEGVIIIGCAGGRDTQIELHLNYEEVDNDYIPFTLEVSGCTGGHSGENIADGRANAIRVMARILQHISYFADIRLIGVQAGTAHNAIPRNAEAKFFIPAAAVDKVKNIVSEMHGIIKQEFVLTEPNLAVSISPISDLPDRRAMLSYLTRHSINLLRAMPHGPIAYSRQMHGKVETSLNLAKTWVADGKLFVYTSQRSSVPSRLNAITERVEAVARLANAHVKSDEGYPSWAPKTDSKLTKIAEEAYKKLYDKEPTVTVIHAGLECGIIGDKHSGMDMISIGPDIINPHSPDEALYLPAISKIYDLVVQIFKMI